MFDPCIAHHIPELKKALAEMPVLFLCPQKSLTSVYLFSKIFMSLFMDFTRKNQSKNHAFDTAFL
jgi:hypothetical protein